MVGGIAKAVASVGDATAGHNQTAVNECPNIRLQDD